MAPQDIDSEHQQMFLTSTVLSASQNPRSGYVTPQRILSHLRVEVTVLRAHNIPHIKRLFGLNKRFFVTVSNLATTRKSESVQIDGQTVQWNQRLGAFSTQSSSHLILSLYEKRSTHCVIVGMLEIPIPVASQSDVPFVLSNGDEDAGQLTHPVTLNLTVTVATKVPPQIFPSPPEIPINEENAKAPIALHRADEAKKLIVRANSWKGAISRIKWVMDTVSPIAELHPFAKMAYDLVSAIPKTLLEQYQRDDRVVTLFEVMHDAFDFSHHEDTLKSIKPGSKQAQILTLMLQDVCNCSGFIQSYAKDSKFWKRTLKNLDGEATKEIENLSAALVEHRRAFLDQAIITTEITTFQVLDDVRTVSAKIDWISAHLVFIGLFSAIVAAFILENYKKLSPDPSDQMIALLTLLLTQLVSISTGAPAVVQSTPSFKPPAYVVRVNVLWLLSLFINLTCALLATLIQQWARRYLKYVQHRGEPSRKRPRIRAYMFDGFGKFGLSQALVALLLLLHISIFLFFVGIVDVLIQPTNKVVAFSALGCITGFAFIIWKNYNS